MKLILKSIAFGLIITIILSGFVWGIAVFVKFLEIASPWYPVVFFVGMVFACVSMAYYFGNK